MFPPSVRLIAVTFSLIFCASGRADVSLSDLFADHMVLQADRPISIWGRAAAGEEVSVSLNGQTARAAAAADGKWAVSLPAQKAGGPYEIEITGRNQIVLHDVLIGEVWVASGQSNMNMRVYPTPPWTLGVVDYERVIAAANHPEIRVFTVFDEASDRPKEEIHGRWEVCTPRTVGNFSAVAYFFAERLQGDLKIPVGMIVSAVGATSIIQWLAPGDATEFPGAQRGAELYAKRKAAATDKLAEYEQKLASYYDENRKDRDIPGKLTPHIEPFKGHFGQPGGLYNAMIAPLTAFPIQGFLWSQGESDSAWAAEYRKALQTLITSWRTAWKEPEAPFLIVQAGARVPFPPKPTETTEPAPVSPVDNRAKLRLAQAAVESLVPKSAVIVSCDLGHPNVHFPDKKPVGNRLALAALKITYGREVEDYRGPIATKASAVNNTLEVEFESPNGRLLSHSGGTLSAFEIAGADGKFWPANAKISGDKVVLSSGFVKSPTQVRYGLSSYPFMSLFDAKGIPARPFVRDVANEKAEEEVLKTSSTDTDSE